MQMNKSANVFAQAMQLCNTFMNMSKSLDSMQMNKSANVFAQPMQLYNTFMNTSAETL